MRGLKSCPIPPTSLNIWSHTGVQSAATPTGCFITTTFVFGVDAGRRSPFTLFASSANHSRNEAPYATSPRASEIGLPF